MTPRLSVVVPLYNEEGNVAELMRRIFEAVSSFSYEVIAVDDGSRDGTFAELAKVAKHNTQLRVVRFAVNAGQTAALAAGIEQAKGEVIVTIDGDLENDPHDIPMLVSKLEEGYDVVSGWRQNRWKDARLTRRLPSHVANSLISAVTKVKLHDYGCQLKAYRRESIVHIDLYGHMHRFIPAYVAAQGGRITEVPVNFSPRVSGKSKYGMSRIFKVLMDLLVVVFFTKFLARPMHFFGGLGILSCFLGFLVACIAIALRLLNIVHFVGTPLPLFAAFLFIVGIQLIIFGVLAELNTRIYYESRGKKPYSIREIL
jgi:glycosyltransferase involved in cell wall biosynthesis